VTTGGGETELPSPAVDDLASGLRGDLARTGDPGYEPARQLWNGMIDRRPALIARCAGAEDVVAAVNFARDHELLLAVRGGGHGVAGHAVCDGGLVIDLSELKGIDVDPESRRVRARAAARWETSTARPNATGLPLPWGW
jgi:FAD/FMN-containing dehydrogenase